VRNIIPPFTLLFSLWLLLFGCSTDQKKNDPVNARRKARLERKDLRDAVTLLGVLEPKNQISLKSEVSGVITCIYAMEGSELKPGDTILTIDPRPFENAKVKLMLQRKKTELEYGILEREYRNDSVLAASGTVSTRSVQDEWDRLALKNVELDAIDIDIKDVNEKLQKSALTAPINGTLLSLDTKVGEIVVSATTGYSGGSTIGILADAHVMQVNCRVNEVDYHALTPETPVSLYLETDPTVRAKGRIAFISRNAKLEENKSVRSFEVRVEVMENNPRLVPGINVSVEFIILDKSDALVLPCDFVQPRPGKTPIVHRMSANGEETEREVKTGVTDYQFIEILSGLSENDCVLEPKPAAE